MVRMVVVRSRPQHQFGIPLTDLGDHEVAILERRHQFAVMDLKDVVRNPDSPGSLGRLSAASPSQRRSALNRMTRIAVCTRDELHVVAHLCPKRGAATHANIAVIRVRTEGNDPELSAGLRQQRTRPSETIAVAEQNALRVKVVPITTVILTPKAAKIGECTQL